MQGKEQNFNTGYTNALHESRQNVQVPKRCGLEKIKSHRLFAMREGPDTYEKAWVSQGRDWWVRAKIGVLQSLQEKPKRQLVQVYRRKEPTEHRMVYKCKEEPSTQVEVDVSATFKEASRIKGMVLVMGFAQKAVRIHDDNRFIQTDRKMFIKACEYEGGDYRHRYSTPKSWKTKRGDMVLAPRIQDQIGSHGQDWFGPKVEVQLSIVLKSRIWILKEANLCLSQAWIECNHIGSILEVV